MLTTALAIGRMRGALSRTRLRLPNHPPIAGVAIPWFQSDMTTPAIRHRQVRLSGVDSDVGMCNQARPLQFTDARFIVEVMVGIPVHVTALTVTA